MRREDKTVFQVAAQVGYPVLLWGPPGMGKTAYLQSYFAKIGRYVETFIAAHKDPVDINGLMVRKGSEYGVLTPDWVNRVCDKKGILFLDELSRATNSVQNVLLDTVQSRRAGGRDFPDEVVVVAAANPSDTSSGAFDMNAALANRFEHIYCGVDVQDWVHGILTEWGGDMDTVELPGNWEDHIPASERIVTAYLHSNPEALMAVPEQVAMQGKPWGSPRTWERVIRYLAAWESIKGEVKDPLNIITRLIGGSVGMGSAASFLNYYQNRDLPKPEELLDGTVELPEDGPSVYVSTLAVSSYVLRNPTRDLWNRGWAVLGNSADMGMPDVAMPAAQMLIEKFGYLNKIGVADSYPKDLHKFKDVLERAGLLPGSGGK